MTTDPFNLARLPVVDTAFEKIFPYPKNHKKHSAEQIEKLKISILNQGLMDPIIVDKSGYIISGHGRFEAIKKMRDEDPERFKIVPVKWAILLTEVEAAAARIVSNKLSSNDYYVDILQSELEYVISSSDDFDWQIKDLILETKEVDVFTNDMGKLDLDALAEDLNSELADQDSENAKSVEATDQGETALSKIFGYSKVPTKSVKTIERFLAVIENESSKTSLDALLYHMEKHIE